MTLARVLQFATSASFAALALIALRDWFVSRGEFRAYLAAAMGGLGFVSLVGEMNRATGYRYASAVSDVTLIAFLASGYAFLRFRDVLIPLSPRIRRLALTATVVAAVLAVAVRLPVGEDPAYTPLQSLAVNVLVGVWAASVFEPAYRFLRAGRRLPPIQRARVRALGAGYLGIVVVLVIAVAFQGAEEQPAYEVAIQLLVLLAIPFLYASFAPPGWLRSIWRSSVETSLGGAIAALLASEDRPGLARDALSGALRLVGADSGRIVDASGALLADAGPDARRLEGLPPATATTRVDPLAGGRMLLSVPLPSTGGRGTLGVVSGPFTPLFGSDEVATLERYAATVAIALERARLTDQLRHREAELEHAQQVAQLGSWRYDGERDRFEGSGEFTRLFGVEPGDSAASDVLGRAHPDDAAWVRERIVALAGGRTTEDAFDVRVLRRDGGVRWVSVRARGAGDGRTVSGTTIDVTERKEAEEALLRALDREREAADRLREADRVKDEFLATVSHELRTPLTLIIGYGDLLASEWDRLDEQRRRDLVGRIELGAQDMSGLVEQLLDLSRIEAGKVQLQPVPVRLREAVDRLAAKMAGALSSHRLVIRVAGDVVVRADPHALERVLGNLLSNAAKFSPSGSEVVVSAEPEGSEVRVDVRDHGPGIAAEDGDRVFDRFYQGRTAVQKGSGLGLAIARRYTEMLGGRIWMRPEPDGGTTFSFTLPAT